jgi:RNA polymerase sigma factor (sigma-70 family)
VVLAEPSDSDQELLHRWQEGDLVAGDRLFRRHFGAVYRFFRNKLPDRVDDLVQATFAGCVGAVDRMDPTRSFRAYLLGIAKNQLLMELRRRGRRPGQVALDSESVEMLTGGFSQAVELRQEERVLLAALRRLPLREKSR